MGTSTSSAASPVPPLYAAPTRLMRFNAAWADQDAAVLSDGDAELDHKDFSGFAVPHCASCQRTPRRLTA
jgi:hypothetical protein